MAGLEDELTGEMLDFLDDLVARGRYRDRGEALRGVLSAVMKGVRKARNTRSLRTKPVRPGRPVKRIDTGGDVTILLKTF